LAQNFYG